MAESDDIQGAQPLKTNIQYSELGTTTDTSLRPHFDDTVTQTRYESSHREIKN